MEETDGDEAVVPLSTAQLALPVYLLGIMLARSRVAIMSETRLQEESFKNALHLHESSYSQIAAVPVNFRSQMEHPFRWTQSSYEGMKNFSTISFRTINWA